jgi:hypothetical protein
MSDDRYDWLILGGGLTILVCCLIALAVFAPGAQP